MRVSTHFFLSLLYLTDLLGSDPIYAHSMSYFYSFVEATLMISFFVCPALGDNFQKAQFLYFFSFSF